jgi:hypothetical protein
MWSGVAGLVAAILLMRMAAGASPLDRAIDLRVEAPPWVTEEETFAVTARATNIDDLASPPLALLPAYSQPICRPPDDPGAPTFDLLPANESTAESLALRCTGVARLGVGAMALSPTAGPLAEAFVLVTVTDRSFARLAPASLSIVAIMLAAVALLAGRPRLPPHTNLVLATVAAGATLVAFTALQDLPLQHPAAGAFFRFGLFLAAVVLGLVAAMRSTIGRFTFAGILLAALLAMPPARPVLTALAIGTVTLLLVGFVRRWHPQPLYLAWAFGWPLLSVLVLRPALFELLAWGLYGERLTVIPFQA